MHRKNVERTSLATVTATFDINEYINGIDFSAEPTVPFGQFESTSNEEYKNLMGNYLDKSVRNTERSKNKTVLIKYFRKVHHGEMHLATGWSKTNCKES